MGVELEWLGWWGFGEDGYVVFVWGMVVDIIDNGSYMFVLEIKFGFWECFVVCVDWYLSCS